MSERRLILRRSKLNVMLLLSYVALHRSRHVLLAPLLSFSNPSRRTSSRRNISSFGIEKRIYGTWKKHYSRQVSKVKKQRSYETLLLRSCLGSDETFLSWKTSWWSARCCCTSNSVWMLVHDGTIAFETCLRADKTSRRRERQDVF